MNDPSKAARQPGRQEGRVMVVSCPDADAEAFARLVALVTGYCPRVESVRLGVCAFAARGPARYFNGEEALARKLIAATGEAGFGCRIGVADGLFAALLAAAPRPGTSAVATDARVSDRRAGQLSDSLDSVSVVPAGGMAEFLARQPVCVLDDAELARLGIRTLGDLAALPAESVASRFGEAGEAAHRLARGEQPPAARGQRAARRPGRRGPFGVGTPQRNRDGGARAGRIRPSRTRQRH